MDLLETLIDCVYICVESHMDGAWVKIPGYLTETNLGLLPISWLSREYKSELPKHSLVLSPLKWCEKVR